MLGVCLVAPEEVTLRGGQDAARVVEEELVKHGGDKRSDEIRQRGNRSVVATGRLRAPDRHRHESCAEVTRSVRGETVRCVAPDDSGVCEANDPRDSSWGRKEVGRVETCPDDKADEEVLED